MAEGKARLITGGERKREILHKMMENYQQQGGSRAVSTKDTEKVAIIEIDIHNLSEKEHLGA